MNGKQEKPQMMPSSKIAFSGETKELVCKYNLDKQPIYSLKWYKVGWISINYK